MARTGDLTDDGDSDRDAFAGPPPFVGDSLSGIHQAAAAAAYDDAAVRDFIRALAPLRESYEVVARSALQVIFAVREQVTALAEAQRLVTLALEPLRADLAAANVPAIRAVVKQALVAGHNITEERAETIAHDAGALADAVQHEEVSPDEITSVLDQAFSLISKIKDPRARQAAIVYVGALCAVLALVRDSIVDGWTPEQAPSPPQVNVTVVVPPPDPGQIQRIVDERVRQIESEEQALQQQATPKAGPDTQGPRPTSPGKP